MTKYASVILTIPREEEFSYRIPGHLAGMIVPGCQVVVPFGRRMVSGIVLKISEELPEDLSPEKVKPIQDLVFEQPVVSEELMKLLKWISNYYICYLGEAYRLLNLNLNIQNAQTYYQRIVSDAPEKLSAVQQEILEIIPAETTVSLSTLKKKLPRDDLQSQLNKLKQKGLVRSIPGYRKKLRSVQQEEFFRVADAAALPPEAQQKLDKMLNGKETKISRLYRYLTGKAWVSQAEIKKQGFTRQQTNRLTDAGLLERELRDKLRVVTSGYREKVPDVTVTKEQIECIHAMEPALKEKQFKTFLLHGVTGSGKTQIYIELIRRTLNIGRQAIVLIPEIVLTPQTLARFQHHFGDRVGVIHSRLSAAEKREMLFHIREGRFKVVIGPRSAVFAPVSDLGLVVVDEEHETSYKQSDAQPRYNARDVAIYRAKLNNAVVVLGTASPSFESLFNAQNGRYEYFHLFKRIQTRNLPRVSIVNLRDEWRKSSEPPILSENLELKVESRLLTREQVMILQNRRGYAPYLLCQDCGNVPKCPHCDVTLTYHQPGRKLVCHYCGYSEKAPDACPNCQGTNVIYKGIGTQKLQEVFLEKFSDTKILRMDQDTTRGRDGHATILESFRNGEADILLGTKMIAKGLDFKRVSLVGIISADQGLYFPDFRANERVFQLLMQAAGRAGRGKNSGEVLVQTFDPTHPIFKFLLTHDYMGFYQWELSSRKRLNYPPFSRIILLRIEGRNLPEVQLYSARIAKFLRKINHDRSFTILGPSPAPLMRIKDHYRYHILLKKSRTPENSMSRLRRLLKEGLYKNVNIAKWPVKLIIDVDPVEIL